MILITLFLLNTILISCFCGVWDTDAIDDYVESVRNCWERPAITIGIVELDEHDQIKQSYANAYGRVDPTCRSNCARVSQIDKIVGICLTDSVNKHSVIFRIKIFDFTSYF